MKILSVYKSTDTIPFAILYIEDEYEFNDNLIVRLSTGETITLVDWDYYLMSDVSEETCVNVLVDILKLLENKNETKDEYVSPVEFSSTGNYGNVVDDEDDVYTVEEFIGCCNCGAFIDYDGFGYPVKDGFADPSIIVKPSNTELIPDEATHIVWFNK